MNISELGEKISVVVSSNQLTESQKLAIKEEFYTMLLAEMKWDRQKLEYASKVNEAVSKLVEKKEPVVEQEIVSGGPEQEVPKKGVRASVQAKQNDELSEEDDSEPYEVEVE